MWLDASTKNHLEPFHSVNINKHNSSCQSLTLSPHGKPFVKRLVARCVILTAKSMSPSLHTPSLSAAYNRDNAQVMSKVGLLDEPRRGEHSGIAHTHRATVSERQGG